MEHICYCNSNGNGNGNGNGGKFVQAKLHPNSRNISLLAHPEWFQRPSHFNGTLVCISDC